MPPANHPLWKLLFLVVLLAAVGVYMEVAYAHGFDPLKDGGLIAFLAALAGLWNKYGSGPGG